jgi:hypothetical protein
MSILNDVEDWCNEHDVTGHIDVNLGIVNIGIEGKL